MPIVQLAPGILAVNSTVDIREIGLAIERSDAKYPPPPGEAPLSPTYLAPNPKVSQSDINDLEPLVEVMVAERARLAAKKAALNQRDDLIRELTSAPRKAKPTGPL